MNQNLNTMEGCRYKITLKFTGQEDLGNYSIYGSSCHLGCSRCYSNFEILEKNADSCIMAIPALKAGTHLYQVFIKHNSTNQEFLILDGRIEVKNRCGDDDAGAINSTSSEVEIIFNAEEIQVDVTIHEGTKGEKGEKGERGEKGEDGIDGKDGVDGKDGEDGKDGQDGTIDLIFLGNNVAERTNGRASDNQTIYGCGWTFTKTGYVDMVQLQAPQLEEGESIFAKVWDASTKTLLSKSKNSLNKGSREPFYLEPFAVNKGQEVKITFHNVEDGSTSLKTGIAVYTRISFIADGESGGIIDDTGNYSDTTKTATIRWNFFENKFSSKEELSEHAASDSHLSDEQKTLLEQVKNGEIGGGSGGASTDWIQNTDKGVISIGKNQSLVHNSNPSLITRNSIVIGNNTRCADYGVFPVTTERCAVIGHNTTVEEHYCCTLGNNIGTYGQDAVAIGEYAQSNYRGISIGSDSWTSNNAVAIGYNANSDSYGIAIGDNAQADYGNITLKSGNVEVKFTSEGMTINGNAIGGGIDMGNIYKYMGKYSKLDYLYQIEEIGMKWSDEYGTEIYRYIDDMIQEGGVWQYSLDYLQEADQMFNAGNKTGADRITKFISNTPLLQNANYMFYGCTNLEYLYMDFSSIMNYNMYQIFGYDTDNCTKLNAESLHNIADTIVWGDYNDLYIGINGSLRWDNGDGEYQKCQDALQRIRDKGWTVYEIYSENY